MPPNVHEPVDIAIVGAGAAGLMAGLWAGRTLRAGPPQTEERRHYRVVILDSARTLGAKILVAGGGRCNVTHDVVDEAAFAGSSRHAIRKVLRRFGVQQTVEFFGSLGVQLKREETGKLFPTTDRARTVLTALLAAVQDAGAEVRHPWRVKELLAPCGGEPFIVVGDSQSVRARRVILATGGQSLPKTGSDGHGYWLARNLGHSVTPRVFPALVPLTLPTDHFLRELSGVSTIATAEVRNGRGRRIAAFTDSLLCTHFGLSGPCILDISRYFLDAQAEDSLSSLVINWLPGQTTESVDAALQKLGNRSPGRWLREFGSGERADQRGGIPQRLAEAICRSAGVDSTSPASQLTREKRRALVTAVTQMELPITGDRGFSHAEVTAGGVPLTELHLDTMESRVCPGLYICGEICDVDGRIGGYNFQWAWASGFVAGTAAATAHRTDFDQRTCTSV